MTHTCETEHDFALILRGVPELSQAVEDALFEAGCDDCTISMSYGQLWLEFARSAPSLKDAILSAISQVRSAGIGAEVIQVDECNLVTQAEIARRMHRTRQLVNQYIKGVRGPGGFPAPLCYIRDQTPLWQWCAVSYWLSCHDLIRASELERAEVICAVNNALERSFQKIRNPNLVEEVSRAVEPMASGR
jgi:hypothetical protein